MKRAVVLTGLLFICFLGIYAQAGASAAVTDYGTLKYDMAMASAPHGHTIHKVKHGHNHKNKKPDTAYNLTFGGPDDGQEDLQITEPAAAAAPHYGRSTALPGNTEALYRLINSRFILKARK